MSKQLETKCMKCGSSDYKECISFDDCTEICKKCAKEIESAQSECKQLDKYIEEFREEFPECAKSGLPFDFSYQPHYFEDFLKKTLSQVKSSVIEEVVEKIKECECYSYPERELLTIDKDELLNKLKLEE